MEKQNFWKISEPLETTLSRRVSQLRRLRNLTLEEVSERTNFTVARLEDIEAGLETWLSATDRQKLARALTVDPPVLQEVEVKPRLEPSADPKRWQAILDDLTESILLGARELSCPQCGHTLRCRVQEGLDINENPIFFAKAFCQKCPFTLK
ncbi:MAG: helix-turn-helix domain-containing protein [Candidatus Melainabacteria bacterium]|nr:helix-turn-helix domain-containing protein [Candidatus Melainabacteria bacterium]